MSAAYIEFKGNSIIFTPSAVSAKGEHVTIKVIPTVPCPRWHRRRAESMQYEMVVRIPPRFDEKVWVFVYIDKHPRKKWRNWFALEVEVDGGVITDVVTYMNKCPENLNPSGVIVKYPSGEYDSSEYEWHKYQMP